MDLNSNWTLSFVSPSNNARETIPAQVPGNVIGDLHRAGLIDDPYWNDNSVALRPWEYVDWEYRTTFTAPKCAAGERLSLCFDGIDTIAEIFVNGTRVGESKDMFVETRVDVTDAVVQGGDNELTVRIQSSLNYARQFKRCISATSLRYQSESLYIRRPRHTYGWDIAPRIVGAGLWRGVHLDILKPIRWTDSYLFTYDIQGETATLYLAWAFTTNTPTLEGYEAILEMACGDSTYQDRFPLRFVNGEYTFQIDHAKFWWPRGSGEPNLYDVRLTLLHDGAVADVRAFRMGVREISLKRTETLDANREGEFCFIVNNKPVFVRGSNWVPADALHGENLERTRKGLALFAELNCNMVRCWGGSVYESDDFYNACDELGLMVWQDFTMACEVPPHDDWYLDLLKREAKLAIERIRQHPSLALWCGDNEGDEAFFGGLHKHQLPSYNIVGRQILRRMVEENDPARDYLPCSPYLNDDLKRRNARYLSPEQHLWGPRDNHKNSFYKDNSAIFASEIGYHGMPCLKSIQKFLPESSWNGRMGDPGWNCHAAQPFGDLNGAYSYRTKLMIDQVDGCFGEVPDDLRRFICASQIVQAEAKKFFIENFRQKKWKKTGLIWWNMIDCWPQFSDAVVDYYYAKKLAYYYIRTAQQPVLLSFTEPDAWCITLVASNDTPKAASGSYRVFDLMDESELMQGEFSIAGDSSASVASLRVSQGRPRMLVIEWELQGETHFNHYALNFPPMNLALYETWIEKLNRVYYHVPTLFDA